MTQTTRFVQTNAFSIVRRFRMKKSAIKTAVIGAAAFPQFLWLAAGSENMLSRQALQCLKGRLTLVYPDRDAISNWTAELQKMEDITHFQVSSLCERVAPADLPKYDVADYILQHLRPII